MLLSPNTNGNNPTLRPLQKGGHDISLDNPLSVRTA